MKKVRKYRCNDLFYYELCKQAKETNDIEWLKCSAKKVVKINNSDGIFNRNKNANVKLVNLKSNSKENRIKEIERSGKRELDVDNAVKFLLENYHFISLSGKKLFYFNGKYYEEIDNVVNAAAIFKECLDEEYNRLTSGYREIYQQMLSEKSIWVNHIDDLKINEHRIAFLNGTYDVQEDFFYENQFFAQDYMFSVIKFNYEEINLDRSDVVDRFVSNFTNGDERKEQLLYEILGFILSSYSNKKACFYFLGVPNAGKSVLCKFVELAVGKDLYISIPIKELGDKFNSGELINRKVCVDEDVAINSPLNTRDLSLIKKISSSDTIQTNSKFKQQGYIRPYCKLLWAGNGMFKFSTNEDLTPFAERLIIYPLENSIPKEERDPNIIDKLVDERNYIIMKSLSALHQLVENQFKFSTVVDSSDYVSSKRVVDGISAFVEECCVLDEDAISISAELYKQYEMFCEDSDSYQSVGKNIFSQRLKDKYFLKDHRTTTTRMLVGIALKNT